MQKIAQDRAMRTYDENKHLIVEKTVITKAGVNPYRGSEIIGFEKLGLDPDEIYYLLRCPDELQKSLDSFKSIQLMVKHIQVGADQPSKEYTVGSLGSEIEFDGEDVTTSLRVWDGDAIRLIESGKLQELSAGYFYDADMTKGDYNGVAYDGIMRNIHGNHVALVDRGRIGRDAIIADSLPNDMVGLKMALKKGAYTKIGQKVKKSLAMDSELTEEQIEDIIEAVTEEIPDVEVAEDEADDKTAKDSDDKDDKETADDAACDDERKTAMDEDTIRKNVFEEARLAHEAMEHVRPLVGAMAFDTAENVYRKALSQSGTKYAGNDLEAMKLLVSAKIESKNQRVIAQDSDMGSNPDNIQKNLDRFVRG